MRANCWYGKQDVRVEQVPDPKILNRRDAIVKISSTAICGSDLHLYNGFMPTMEKGDILGHEFMGEIVEKMFGHSPCGIFGYSHLTGGFAGGQAEYARVPFADVGTIKVPEGMSDEQVLFLSDIFPTGYMGAEMCDIKGGDTIAVWGCGPVGQFAIASAKLLGAERVIAIDRVPERLRLAATVLGAETVDYEEVDSVIDVLKDLTAGRGPDHCIDAVGVEGHTHGVQYVHDRAKQVLRMQTDRPIALREAILSCRNGGTVSVIG